MRATAICLAVVLGYAGSFLVFRHLHASRVNNGPGGPEEYRTHLVVDGVCGTVMGYAFRPLMALDARVTGRDTLLISHQQGRVRSILYGYDGC